MCISYRMMIFRWDGFARWSAQSRKAGFYKKMETTWQESGFNCILRIAFLEFIRAESMDSNEGVESCICMVTCLTCESKEYRITGYNQVSINLGNGLGWSIANVGSTNFTHARQILIAFKVNRFRLLVWWLSCTQTDKTRWDFDCRLTYRLGPGSHGLKRWFNR